MQSPATFAKDKPSRPSSQAFTTQRAGAARAPDASSASSTPSASSASGAQGTGATGALGPRRVRHDDGASGLRSRQRHERRKLDTQERSDHEPAPRARLAERKAKASDAQEPALAWAPDPTILGLSLEFDRVLDWSALPTTAPGEYGAPAPDAPGVPPLAEEAAVASIGEQLAQLHLPAGGATDAAGTPTATPVASGTPPTAVTADPLWIRRELQALPEAGEAASARLTGTQAWRLPLMLSALAGTDEALQEDVLVKLADCLLADPGPMEPALRRCLWANGQQRLRELVACVARSGTVASVAAQTLLAQITSSSPQASQQIFLALDAMGDAALDAIVRILAHQNDDVATRALTLMNGLGSASTQAADRLLERLLARTQRSGRPGSMRLLALTVKPGAIGPLAVQCLESLAQTASGGWTTIGQMLLQDTASALRGILKALASTPPAQRACLLWFLAQVAEADVTSCKALRDALVCPSRAGGRTLGSAGYTATPLLKTLVQGLAVAESGEAWPTLALLLPVVGLSESTGRCVMLELMRGQAGGHSTLGGVVTLALEGTDRYDSAWALALLDALYAQAPDSGAGLTLYRECLLGERGAVRVAQALSQRITTLGQKSAIRACTLMMWLLDTLNEPGRLSLLAHNALMLALASGEQGERLLKRMVQWLVLPEGPQRSRGLAMLHTLAKPVLRTKEGARLIESLMADGGAGLEALLEIVTSPSAVVPPPGAASAGPEADTSPATLQAIVAARLLVELAQLATPAGHAIRKAIHAAITRDGAAALDFLAEQAATLASQAGRMRDLASLMGLLLVHVGKEGVATVQVAAALVRAHVGRFGARAGAPLTPASPAVAGAGGKTSPSA